MIEDMAMKFLDEINRRAIASPSVIEAMGKINRAEFIPEIMQQHAEKNSALPIACQQTISQPTIVAMMSEAILNRDTGEIPQKILEIGTGSGYQSAVLAQLGCQVYSIERHFTLYNQAKQRLKTLGYSVMVKHGNGWQGWAEQAPFHAIMVTAAAQEIPGELLAQMSIGAVMVIPIGKIHDAQDLKRIVKISVDDYHEEILAKVIFVPFLNEDAQ